jgi:histidinol-phosphate aminotransferase
VNDYIGLPSPRPEILETPQAHHGAFDYGELEREGLNPDDVLDFSVNSNPYGPSPAVMQALSAVPLDRYPDRDSQVLRRALGAHLGGILPSRIVAGNGTAELVWQVAQSFLRTGDDVLVVGPTFGEYERASALMGARVVRWTAQPDQSFDVDALDVARCLEELRPRLAFVCNPNNPTGTMLSLDAIVDWARSSPGTLFMVDEAYMAFGPGNGSAVVLTGANVLVLRSMTKDYGLAGLRLGYAVGHEAIVDALARIRPAWNVNALAQAAGVAALSDQAYLVRTLEDLVRDKETLVEGLRKLGWSPLPSAVHFFLMQVGDGAAFRQELLRHRIQVRDCASFGLPAYVRIAPRRPEENAQLLAAVGRAGRTGA